MRTRSMRKVRILDQLPPEVLSLVLSQMLPQDMLVQRCSRRWRDADLDASYWKPLFLNTFGEAAQTTTTKRRKAPSREWRDRYERAWRLRVDVSREPGTGALGLHLGRFVSSYDHRVRPTNIFHAIDGQGVLSVPDIRGKELELRYYIHDEGIAVGAFEVDDVWVHPDPYVHPDDDVDDDAEDPDSDTEYRWIDAGILKGLVVYTTPWEPSTIQSAPRWAAGASGSVPRFDTCWKRMVSISRTLILTGTREWVHNSGSAASDTSSLGSRTVTIIHSGTSGRSS